MTHHTLLRFLLAGPSIVLAGCAAPSPAPPAPPAEVLAAVEAPADTLPLPPGTGFNLEQPTQPASGPGVELVVPAGTTRPIAAQRWEFSRVEIQKGATLRVTPGGTAPLQLIVRGPMILHGTIESRRSSSEDRTVVLAVPAQQPLTLTYASTNQGGAGGYGGQGGGVQGAGGAAGTLEYGGGGGGGGGRHQDALGTKLFPGRPAQGQQGGPWGGGLNCGSRGGMGASRDEYANGGTVYLRVEGDFDGSGGVIDVRGSPGRSGEAGAVSVFPSSSYGCQGGGGGGGGGAPGGHGGHVVVYIGGEVVDYPSPLTAGGAGGPGGAGGATSGTDPRKGTPGTRGQGGKSGAVHFFTAPS